MLLVALRVVAFIIGLMAFYIAFLMHEDEEGKWQSRVEQLWVQIDDRAKLTGRRSASFFAKIAAVVAWGLNRIFGQKLVSAQFVGVSSSYSFAGLFLSAPILFIVLLRPENLTAPIAPSTAKSLAFVEHFCIIVGIILFLFAALPTFWPSRLFIALSLLPGLLFTTALLRLIQLHRPFESQLRMFVILLASFLSDLALVTLVRLTVRNLSVRTSPLAIVVAIAIQGAAVIVLVVVPYELTSHFVTSSASQAAMTLAMFNAFTGLIVCIFLIVLLFVLIHRVAWPILSKLFYPLARYSVVRNHKAMAAIGTACILFAVPTMWSTVKSILEWLAK